MSTSVDQMQQGLEKALQAASQADDRELAGKVRDEGRRLVFILHGLLRTSRLHDKDNAAFEQPSVEFSVTLQGLLDLLGAVHVVCVEDQIYVNDIRLRGNPREQMVIESFVQEFARHHAGGVSFHNGVVPESVREMAQLVAESPEESDNPRKALEDKLTPLGDISLQGIHRFRIGGEPTEQKKDYQDAVRRGAAVVAEAVHNLAADRIPNPLPVRRAVIDMVNSVREKPGSGLGESFRRNAGTVGEQHLLSVSSLALALGQEIELPEGALSDLGTAAMLHDVGYTKVPDRTGHCAAGARLLMKQRGFHEAKIRRLLLVLEHHLPYKPKPSDGKGAGDAFRPTLFARLLKIVDDYDVLVSPRPGQPPPLSPAMGIAKMWAARGNQYDPHLLAAFARMMGRFPPGTLLELSDGRWGISVSGGRDKARFNWPVVRIMRNADGTPQDGKEEIDLFEVHRELAPARVLDPAEQDVDVAGAMALEKEGDEDDKAPLLEDDGIGEGSDLVFEKSGDDAGDEMIFEIEDDEGEASDEDDEVEEMVFEVGGDEDDAAEQTAAKEQRQGPVPGDPKTFKEKKESAESDESMDFGFVEGDEPDPFL